VSTAFEFSATLDGHFSGYFLKQHKRNHLNNRDVFSFRYRTYVPFVEHSNALLKSPKSETQFECLTNAFVDFFSENALIIEGKKSNFRARSQLILSVAKPFRRSGPIFGRQ
jgi:hypothetical protein